MAIFASILIERFPDLWSWLTKKNKNKNYSNSIWPVSVSLVAEMVTFRRFLVLISHVNFVSAFTSPSEFCIVQFEITEEVLKLSWFNFSILISAPASLQWTSVSNWTFFFFFFYGIISLFVLVKMYLFWGVLICVKYFVLSSFCGTQREIRHSLFSKESA